MSSIGGKKDVLFSVFFFFNILLSVHQHQQLVRKAYLFFSPNSPIPQWTLPTPECAQKRKNSNKKMGFTSLHLYVNTFTLRRVVQAPTYALTTVIIITIKETEERRYNGCLFFKCSIVITLI